MTASREPVAVRMVAIFTGSPTVSFVMDCSTLRLMDSTRFVLKGGLVFDGSGEEPEIADVAVEDGVIAGVDHHMRLRWPTVDVRGRCVMPGFVDTHTHTDVAFTQTVAGLRTASVRQGVTTEVCGNCGFSPFPVKGNDSARLRRYLSPLFGSMPPVYNDLVSFRRAVVNELYANLAPLVGHGTIRASVVGFERRHSTARESSLIAESLHRALDEGAFGISTGLIYPPGEAASTLELHTVARLAATFGRPWACHIRNEADSVIESIQEVVSVAAATGAHLHLSHLKIAGRRNCARVSDLSALIRGATARGIRVTVDAYPYEYASTMLSAVLPPWVYEGGPREMARRLADPAVRRRVNTEMSRPRVDWQRFIMEGEWDRVVIASSPGSPGLAGRSIAALAAEAGTTPVDLVCDLLIREDAGVVVVLNVMNRTDVLEIMSMPELMVGSDSIPLPGRPHPRVAGSFAKTLRLARQAGIGTMAEVVRRITALPAQTFGLRDRGMIRPGMRADIAILDGARVRDRATLSEPLRSPSGLDSVYVNGVAVVRGGRVTGAKPGSVLIATSSTTTARH